MNHWNRTRPIVVEIDRSGPSALDFAYQEAARAHADLIIVAPHQNFLPSPQTSAATSDVLAEQALGTAVGRLRERNDDYVNLTALSLGGPRLEALSEIAAPAHLLVVGAPDGQGPHGLVSAQRSLQLAGRSGRPLAVVPRRWRPSSADDSVAVGIDGTELSLEAVAFAFETAARRTGELLVIHSHLTPYRTRGDASWMERACLTVAETLAGWDEEYPAVKVTRLVTARPVVDVLAQESENHGLVVLGAHAGRTPLDDPVARRAVAAMRCPVAIVPHHVSPAESDRLHRRTALPQPGLGVPTY
jgi:hypothetical protein